jgi:prolyl-tRNA synthetase
VSGDAQVSGDARVSGDAHILTIGPIGSRSATITIHADALLGVRFTTGCFSGCRSRFVTAVADTHRSGKFRMQYDLAVKLADISVIPCPVGVATGAKIATP